MPSDDPHNYGQCWCGRDMTNVIVYHQSIWQDGYDAGLLAATKSPSDPAAPLEVDCYCSPGYPHKQLAAPPSDPAAPLREAYLAGVRRGASDGMESYPMVADDYLAALAPEEDRGEFTIRTVTTPDGQVYRADEEQHNE